MQGIVCDRCGGELLIESDVRYVLDIEVRAAYDPMEISSSDLERDFDKEYRKAIEAASAQSADELQKQVYFQGRYDLCPPCQRELLSDRLFRPRPADTNSD